MRPLSRLEPTFDFACSVAEYWDGVLRWFTSKVTNGHLEAIASLVQAAKRRARGYRTTRKPEGDPLSRRWQARFQTGRMITHTTWQRAAYSV